MGELVHKAKPLGGGFNPTLAFETDTKMGLLSNAQTISKAVEVEANSNYIIVMAVDDHYGDYDYAYYTYGTARVVQDVGTLTDVTPAASTSYVDTAASGNPGICRHRTFIFSLVTKQGGTITLEYAGVKATQYNAQCSVNFRVVKI